MLVNNAISTGSGCASISRMVLIWMLFIDLCVVEFREGDGVVTDKVFNLLVQGVEDCRVGGDDGGLVAVTAREVLRGDDCDRGRSGPNQNHLAVVVGEVGMLNDLRDERPQTERFLRGFEIEHEVDSFYIARFGDEVEPAQKLLGNRERGLPNGAFANLRKHPFDNIRHLQRVGQIALRLVRLQGF